jgi:hypothetical protein
VPFSFSFPFPGTNREDVILCFVHTYLESTNLRCFIKIFKYILSYIYVMFINRLPVAQTSPIQTTYGLALNRLARKTDAGLTDGVPFPFSLSPSLPPSVDPT